MNDTNKKSLSQQKAIKNSFLKFSNTVLFENRERNLSSRKDLNPKKQKKINRSKKYINIKKQQKNKDIFIPLCKTMSSFYHSKTNSYNILPLLEYFEKNNIAKKKRKIKDNNFFICETERNNNDNFNNFFITDTIPLRTTKKSYFNKKNINNKEIDLIENNKKNPNIDVLLLIQSSRKETNNNHNQKSGIESYLSKGKTYYNNFPFTKTEHNMNYFDKISDETYANYVLDLKLTKYEIKGNKSFKGYINKLQEQKIYSHRAKAKTERLKRLEEAHQSQTEFYKDSINSFIAAEKLLENDFVNKITDYTKYIVTKREREKIKNALLRQEIMNYRKEIEQIKNKINKIELEKKNTIKWIFLQICMKEKKLTLPEHYKNIISYNNVNKSSKRLILNKEDSSFNEKKKNIKKLFLKSKDNLKVINKILKKKDSAHNSKHILNEQIEKIEKIEQKDRKDKSEEYKRILNYKNNLIFKTPEEFKDRLISLEKGNLTLLQYKDILNNQLFKYKRELDLLIKEKFKFENEFKIVKEMKKEVNDNKYMMKEKIKILNLLKNTKFNKDIDKKEKEEESKTHINEKNEQKYKNKNLILYKSIYSIFENCKEIGSQLKFGSRLLNLLKRKINTNEKEMLVMLEFIEQTSDYLIMTIKTKLNQNKETKLLFKEINSKIEDEHKLEKAKMQLMNDLKKNNLLEEKVEKRYNKIYFLPLRKLNITQFRTKKKKKINKEILKEPTIRDYLYNEEKSEE